MELRKRTKEQGFTLIEIIAVLIILGILAAVAVPKYMDMQTSAREKAVQGAMSSLKSSMSMCYAKSLIDTDTVFYSDCDDENYSISIPAGDFTGKAADGTTAGNFTITIESGPDWWSSTVDGSTSSIVLY